jgi:hypothetical protein
MPILFLRISCIIYLVQNIKSYFVSLYLYTILSVMASGEKNDVVKISGCFLLFSLKFIRNYAFSVIDKSIIFCSYHNI